MLVLDSIINQTFLPNTTEYTFSEAHGTFSIADHMHGHKDVSRYIRKLK